MTRRELKKMIYDVSKQDTSSPKDCIHLLSLHRFIEQIFDEHEAHVNDLRNAIDRYMEEAAMYKSILDKAEAQLKAKDDEIKELGEIVQQYLIPSKNYDAIIIDKDKDIEMLRAIVAKTISKDIVGGFKLGDKKARSIVAMLFWEWKKQCKNCEQYNDHAFAREQKRSEAYYCFKKAYAMLKDEQC